VFGELECGSINAIIRSERRRQQKARDERGTSAVLQVLGEYVRRVGPHVGMEVLDAGAVRELGEIFDDLVLRVAPREVGIRLCETQLRKSMHYFRPRESFGEQYHF